MGWRQTETNVIVVTCFEKKSFKIINCSGNNLDFVFLLPEKLHSWRTGKFCNILIFFSIRISDDNAILASACIDCLSQILERVHCTLIL